MSYLGYNLPSEARRRHDRTTPKNRRSSWDGRLTAGLPPKAVVAGNHARRQIVTRSRQKDQHKGEWLALVCGDDVIEQRCKGLNVVIRRRALQAPGSRVVADPAAQVGVAGGAQNEITHRRHVADRE